jgi:hypothetical protein
MVRDDALLWTAQFDWCVTDVVGKPSIEELFAFHDRVDL